MNVYWQSISSLFYLQEKISKKAYSWVLPLSPVFFRNAVANWLLIPKLSVHIASFYLLRCCLKGLWGFKQLKKKNMLQERGLHKNYYLENILEIIFWFFNCGLNLLRKIPFSQLQSSSNGLDVEWKIRMSVFLSWLWSIIFLLD